MEYRIEKLDDHTWRIEEYDDSNSVYCYLLEGESGALLIDTGFGTIELPAIVQTLTEQPLQVVNTHGHFDHVGGNARFDRVYLHKQDKGVYAQHTSPAMRALFPELSLPTPADNILWMDETQVFDLGGRTVTVLLTPGHTLGSICLLDVGRRWLFTGDTCCKADVLLNLEFSTTVEEYLYSIRKLQAARSQFDVTWPAHHAVPVAPEILDQFEQASERICRGEARGEPLHTVFGDCLRYAYQDIAVDYFQDRIGKNK